MEKIKIQNQHPQVEAKVYEYLYHIVYALACKSGYFRNFSDYDAFACYAAAELFISIRNKVINAGTEVRGKVVIPVKSSLNFIKATIFPLKINYQRDNFATVFDPQIHEGAENIESNMREDIQSQYRPILEEAYKDAVNQVPKFLTEIISKTPFRNDPVFCRRLYISALLTFINDITIPNKIKQKIKDKQTTQNLDKCSEKMLKAYSSNYEQPILWHMDEDLSNYIRLIVTKAKKTYSKELAYYIHSEDLSDELLDGIMHSAYDNYEEPGDDY